MHWVIKSFRVSLKSLRKIHYDLQAKIKHTISLITLSEKGRLYSGGR